MFSSAETTTKIDNKNTLIRIKHVLFTAAMTTALIGSGNVVKAKTDAPCIFQGSITSSSPFYRPGQEITYTVTVSNTYGIPFVGEIEIELPDVHESRILVGIPKPDKANELYASTAFENVGNTIASAAMLNGSDKCPIVSSDAQVAKKVVNPAHTAFFPIAVSNSVK
ncbi:MAG: hypothetical protein WCK31_03780 [bacterium]